MKNSLSLLVLVQLVGLGQAAAQIRHDEASTNLLAVQCSISSGASAANFSEYGEKLAKTVGTLTPVQQVRVFGYLPKPMGSGTSTLGDVTSPLNGAQDVVGESAGQIEDFSGSNPVLSDVASPGVGDGSGEDGKGELPGGVTSNPKILEAVDSTAENSAEGTTTRTDEEANPRGRGQNGYGRWLESVLSWFRDAARSAN